MQRKKIENIINLQKKKRKLIKDKKMRRRILKGIFIIFNGMFVTSIGDSKIDKSYEQKDRYVIIERIECKVDYIQIKINEETSIEDYYEVKSLSELSYEDTRCIYERNNDCVEIMNNKNLIGKKVGQTNIKIISKVDCSKYCYLPVYINC